MKKAVRIIVLCLCIIVPCTIEAVLVATLQISFGALDVVIVFGPFLALFFAIKKNMLLKVEKGQKKPRRPKKSKKSEWGESSVDVLQKALSGEEEHPQRKGKATVIALSVLTGVLAISQVVVLVLWQNQNQAFQSDIAEKDVLLMEANVEVNDLTSEVDELKEERAFYRRISRIVVGNGEKYHRYGYHYLDESKIHLYTLPEALSRGYTACSVCYPNGDAGTILYRGE